METREAVAGSTKSNIRKITTGNLGTTREIERLVDALARWLFISEKDIPIPTITRGDGDAPEPPLKELVTEQQQRLTEIERKLNHILSEVLI